MTTATGKLCPICGVHYPQGDTCPQDGAMLITPPSSADPLLGQTLKGTYQVNERIAEGGMGVIYRATQLPLGRTVIIKAVFPGIGTGNDLVQRFYREAKLLSQLNHPNVVNLIDFGNTEAGVLYMVLEHLVGKTLDDLVPKHKGLPLDLVVDLMKQICSGVGTAHRLNIIHRDLKPANIFLANISGDNILVKILDFGIAKIVNDQQVHLTQNGVMMGSCGYMSPEQITGSAEVDACSDIYSLGGLLYYMVAGQPAYRGNTTRIFILTKQMNERPMPIDFESLGKGEGKLIMPVILRAMDAEPARRYHTVEEFIDDLNGSVTLEKTSNTTFRRRVMLAGDTADTVQNSKAATRHAQDPKGAPDTKDGKEARRPKAERAEPVAESPYRNFYIAGVFAGLAMLAFICATVWKQSASPTVNRPADGGNSSAAATTKPKLTATAQGVTEDEIVLGMSSVLSGPARELGRGMQTGVGLAFQEINDKGGIAGRKLRLVALDDGYEPPRALANMRELNEKRKVFAIIGNVGTPTAEAALPYALENKLIFFGAFTGAKLLRRDPPDRFVFNYRASYLEETAAVVKYLVEVKKIKPEQIAVFAQQDGYGNAGFDGVVKGLRHYGRDADQILRVGYKRNTMEIADAVSTIIKNKDQVKAVIMVPTYRQAAQFVRQCKEAKVDAIFTSVSFVGSEALQEEFRQIGGNLGQGVVVTQVVPPVNSQSTAVLKYHGMLKKYAPGEPPSFVSLEGYISATVLAEALRRASPEVTTDSVITALEAMKGYDLGLGAAITFGPSEHQGQHKVWATVLDASLKYQNLDLE